MNVLQKFFSYLHATRILQVQVIGNEGRFSNWLIHYLVARMIAKRNNMIIQTPNWIGERIFQIKDERIREIYPRFPVEMVKEKLPTRSSIPPFFSLPHRVVDPCLTRPNVQEVFKLQPRIPMEKIPESICAIHVRRGDFLSAGFPVVPVRVMIQAAQKEGFSEHDVRIISEAAPTRTGLFDKFGFPDLEDFLTLVKAKNVFVYPRSTFSQMAALIGNGNIYMPYDYKSGASSCGFKRVEPRCPVVFPTRNNQLE